MKVSMGVLVEQAGIILDRDHPGRTRDAIESVLKQLHSDGVMGPFTPEMSESSEELAHATDDPGQRGTGEVNGEVDCGARTG